jgi:octaprenyl-diphosphate synthase
MKLGYAFQIADDVLDYTADADTLGKNLGDDLAEGKATLPVIHAIAHSDDATRARLRAIVQNGEVDALPEMIAAIHACNSLAYSTAIATNYAREAEAALQGLEENEALAALRGLAQYAISRNH